MGVTGAPQVRLVGRAMELDGLRAVAATAATGRVQVALVEGEAGIGKSRLLAEALEGVRQEGLLVLSGACDELERDRPLRALGEALEVERGTPDLMRADLARLLRVGRDPPDGVGHRAPAVDEGWQIVEAVLDLLEALASTSPVALAVEDLQWADPLTLRALHSITRQLTRLPLAVFGTVRSGSRGVEVDRVISDLLARGAEHVRLGPLSSAEAADLTGEIVGVVAGPGLLDQVGGAGGNPLFVIELVRALLDDGAIDVVDGTAEARPASVPPTLRLTLLRRLSLLPAEALDLLRIASILGSSFSLTELARLAGRDPAHLVPALAGAVDAGLLSAADDRLAFRHDLVRDAIYHDLPVALRKGLHRKAGAVLGGAGVAVERIASHLVLGAAPGDAQVVLWLREAAQHSVARAPATTVRLLQRALEIAGPDDPSRDAIAADLVEPLLLTGRLEESESAAEAVLARWPEPETEVEVRTRLATVMAIGVRYPEAVHQLELASVLAPEDVRPTLAAAKSVLLVLAGELARARKEADRAVEVAERRGNEHARCLGLQAQAMIALAEGFVVRSASIAERAVTVVSRNDAIWSSQVVPELWLGTALADGDRLSEAEVVLQAGRSRAERAGDLARLPLYQWAIAEASLSAGHWDDALAEAQAGLSLIDENANHVGDVFAKALCAHVALHRGDPALARSEVDGARRVLVAAPFEIGFEWMSWIDALLLETQGQPAEALAVLGGAWDSIAPLRYLQATSRAMGPDLVRMALTADDASRALSVTDELERSARRSPTATARGVARRCRGLLAGDPAVLLEAVAIHRAGPRPYLLAAACEDAAMALGRTPGAGDPAPLLDEAVATYERLAATWDVARVRSAQRALGLPHPRQPPPRPRFGWDSLTRTEVKVVSLVSEGLTNKQIAERLFVARRTVATHIEHVLQKLGHSNRVELATEAIRRGITAQAAPRAQRAAQANPRRLAPGPPGD